MSALERQDGLCRYKTEACTLFLNAQIAAFANLESLD